jgi:hypothetical protein
VSERQPMSSDVRRVIYGTLIGFLAMLCLWIGFLFTLGCNATLGCTKSEPTPARTSVPTLAPATPPVSQPAGETLGGQCQASALVVLGAWVDAGAPESEPFEFADVSGATCSGSYADVRLLLSTPGIWYPGGPACATCHSGEIANAAANLDLNSYQGILAGSGRASADVKGEDILGGFDWTQSKLFEVLVSQGTEPYGRPPGLDLNGVIVFAGLPQPTPTPTK